MFTPNGQYDVFCLCCCVFCVCLWTLKPLYTDQDQELSYQEPFNRLRDEIKSSGKNSILN